MQFATILALTDCSPGSLPGLRAARDLARRTKGRLRVGHVLVPRTLAKGEVKSFLAQHEIPVAASDVVLDVDADLTTGLEHLIEEIRPDVVVLSSHRRTGLSAFLFSNTPVLLSAWAHAPILSVRSETPHPRFKKAMVCVDGSPQSQELVDAAAGLLEPKGEIVTLFVVEDSPLVIAGVDVGRYDQGILDKAAEQARAFLKGLRLARPGLTMSIDQRTGDAVHLILDAEKEHAPDVTVVGTAGVGGKAKFVLGKVSSGVIRAARGAVLTLPTRREGEAAS
ncbi:MAG: universal stress protein [Planctomycetaceae bacterium]